MQDYQSARCPSASSNQKCLRLRESLEGFNRRPYLNKTFCRTLASILNSSPALICSHSTKFSNNKPYCSLLQLVGWQQWLEKEPYWLNRSFTCLAVQTTRTIGVKLFEFYAVVGLSSKHRVLIMTQDEWVRGVRINMLIYFWKLSLSQEDSIGKDQRLATVGSWPKCGSLTVLARYLLLEIHNQFY